MRFWLDYDNSIINPNAISRLTTDSGYLTIELKPGVVNEDGDKITSIIYSRAYGEKLLHKSRFVIVAVPEEIRKAIKLTPHSAL